jgi:autotransporter translocation and assembly factor TamB
MTRRRKVTYAVLGFFLVLVVSLYFVLQSEWLANRVLAAAVKRLEAQGARVSIGAVGGSLLSGITLSRIDVTIPGEEEPILSAEALSFRYSPLQLVRKHELGTLSLYGPKLLLQKHDGKWNYSLLLGKKDSTVPKETPAETGELPGLLPFSLKHMSIQNGLVLVRAEQNIEISKVNLFGSIESDSTHSSITLHNGRFTVNNKLKVVQLRGKALLNGEGLSLENFDLKTPKSKIAFTGRMDSLAMTVTLKNSRIDVQEFGDVIHPELALKGLIDVSGTYTQAGKTRSASAKMVLSGGEFRGNPIGLLDFLLEVDNSKYDIEMEKWQLGEGVAKGSLHLDLSGKTPRFAMDFNINSMDLGRLIHRKAVLSGEIKLTGAGSSFANAGATGRIDLRQSTVEGVAIEGLSSAFSYSSGVINLDSLEADACGGQLKTRGMLSKQQIELDTEIHNIGLAALSGLLGTDQLDGVINGYIWVSGPVDNPSLSGTAWLSKAHYRGMAFDHLSLNINVQDALKEPKGLAAVDFASIQVGGQLLKRGSMEVIVQDKDLEYEIWTAAQEGSLDVKGTAQITDGGFEGELSRLYLLYRGQVVENLGNIAASYSQSGVVLAPARLRVLGTEMRLTGLALTQKEARVGIAADSLSLKNLALALGSRIDADGLLDFDLTVSGTPQDPRINLAFDLRGVVAGQASVDSATVSLSYANGSLRTDRFFIYRNGNRSTLSGHFPINLALDTKGTRIPDKEISLDAEFNDVGAWMFLPLKNMIDVAEGRIDAVLSLRGTPRKPLMTGTMDIATPKVIFRPTLTTVNDVVAKLRLEGERLEIVSVSGKAKDGRVDVNGYVSFKGLTPEDYKVSVKARDASMEGLYRDVSNAVVDADVVIERGREMPTVEGDINVKSCLLITEFRSQAVPMAAVKHDVSYDMRVHADRNVRLKNRDADIEMSADVRVRWRPGAMILSGTMDILSGTVTYAEMTRPFTVKKGEFKFSNAPELNPTIDVEAETVVRVTRRDDKGELKTGMLPIKLTVTGTMLEPDFHLATGEVPYELRGFDFTTTDLLSIITGVSTPDAQGTGFNPLTQAGDVGLSMLQKRIARQLEKSIGVDEITVQTALFGDERSAQLVVGKYVRPDVYVSYSHDLFSKVKDEYKVEYYIWKGSSVVGSRDNQGNYNLGIGFKVRY